MIGEIGFGFVGAQAVRRWIGYWLLVISHLLLVRERVSYGPGGNRGLTGSRLGGLGRLIGGGRCYGSVETGG